MQGELGEVFTSFSSDLLLWAVARGWMPVCLSKLTESVSRALAAQVLAAFEKFAPMFEIISLNSLLMCSLWRSHGTVSIDEAAPGQLMREVWL